MLSVLDVAEFVLGKMGPMGAIKLQKLVYYAQARALAELGKPLFRERVEAWMHGPVVCELWQTHVGSTQVTTVGGNAEGVVPEEAALIEEVLEYYGSLSAGQLRQLSHDEHPWQSARDGLPENAPSTAEITHDAMRAFYQGRPWGRANPVTDSDLSVFSLARVEESRRAIREGRVVPLERLDAVPGTGS